MRLLAALALVVCLTAACGDDPSSPSEQPIANYAGNWSGTYTITGCTQTGQVALSNICGLLGGTPSYAFALTQSQRNVSGSFTLGTIQFPSTGGSVGNDGSLTLNGTSQSGGITVVVQWNLRMINNALTGTISQTWTSTSLTGSAIIAGTISTANRLAVAPGGPTTAPLTIRDMAKAMAGSLN